MDETFETRAVIPIKGIAFFMVLPVLVTVIAFASLFSTDVSNLAVGTPLVVTPTVSTQAAALPPAETAEPPPSAEPDVGALYNLGVEAYAQSRYADAAARFREVLVFAPDSAVVHNSLGTALVKLGELEAAAAAFEQAVFLDGGHLLARYNLAVTLFGLEQFTEAEQAFLDLLALDPNHSQAAFGLAVVYVQTGRLENAENAYEMAIRADPAYAQAYLELGLLYAAQEEWSKAEDILEAGMQAAPDSLEIKYNLGVVYIERGDLRAARLALTSVMANDPGGAWGALAEDALAEIDTAG